nr:hypothetical protein [Tanacetum cinerariifolium]
DLPVRRREDPAGAQPGQLHHAGRRRPVHLGLPRLAENGVDQHHSLPDHRLSHGLRHLGGAQGGADRPVAADHDADLDGNPDP